MHEHVFFYVYILKCSDGTNYKGFTNDLTRRLDEHESGKSRQSYTYDKRPVELVLYETFTDPETGIAYEKKLKKWSKLKKEALIIAEYHKLPELAKKKFKKQSESLGVKLCTGNVVAFVARSAREHSAKS
jgi:putative endonuclease